MPAQFKNKSLVRSWVETVNFLGCPMKGGVLTSLVSFMTMEPCCRAIKVFRCGILRPMALYPIDSSS
jgi:hypothetical protein